MINPCIEGDVYLLIWFDQASIVERFGYTSFESAHDNELTTVVHDAE
jgi:hypothetical protein